MPNVIIFDFDGTLADTGHIYYDVFAQLANKYSLPEPSEEEMDKMQKMSIRERLRYYDVPMYRLPKIAHEAMRIYRDQILTANPCPGMKDVVAEIRDQNIKCYIVSSNHVAIIRTFLIRHDMDHFDHIYGKAPLFGKHRLLRHLIKSNHIDKKNALYVGDEIRDIRSCQRIHLPVAAVTWGYDHKELLEKGRPDHLIERPSDLKLLLQGKALH